jgi:hypothetical protein
MKPFFHNVFCPLFTMVVIGAFLYGALVGGVSHLTH